MRNDQLIAELNKRHATSDDLFFLLVLKELNTLYATIDRMSAYTRELERESAYQEA